MATKIEVDGQIAWRHDEGDDYGYFETYDQFQIRGPEEKPRKIHVLLPRDYRSSSERYPVVYVHDGNTAFWPAENGKSWYMQKRLSYNGSNVRKIMIVAVHAVDRIYEYTHAQLREDWPYGGLAAYTEYLADHVKPWIDSHYRTESSAHNTMVLGASGGGLASFYISAVRPDRFGIAVCFSPALSAGLDFNMNLNPEHKMEDSELFQLIDGKLKNKEMRPRFWLWWGLLRDGQFHNEVIEGFIAYRGQETVQLLCNKYGYELGKDVIIFEDPWGQHEEKSWTEFFIKVLETFYFKNHVSH